MGTKPEPLSHITGVTVDAKVFNSSGQIWNNVAKAWQTFANGTIASYQVNATQFGSLGTFQTEIPVEITDADWLYIEYTERAGGSMALSDAKLGDDTIYWTGSAIFSGVKIADILRTPGNGGISLNPAGFVYANDYQGNVISTAAAVTNIQSRLPAALVGGKIDATATVSDKTDFKLALDGIDAILVEAGISPSANLVDDNGDQLTTINLRQGGALLLAALAGLVQGAQAGSATIQFNSAGNHVASRIQATVPTNHNGNRTSVALKVPA